MLPWTRSVVTQTSAVIGLEPQGNGKGNETGRIATAPFRARVLLSSSAAQDALNTGTRNAGLLSRELSNEISLARSDLVKALIEAELTTVPNVRVTGSETADVLSFTATAALPELAALYANTWANAYVTFKQSEASASIGAATAVFRERLSAL